MLILGISHKEIKFHWKIKCCSIELNEAPVKFSAIEMCTNSTLLSASQSFRRILKKLLKINSENWMINKNLHWYSNFTRRFNGGEFSMFSVWTDFQPHWVHEIRLPFNIPIIWFDYFKEFLQNWWTLSEIFVTNQFASFAYLLSGLCFCSCPFQRSRPLPEQSFNGRSLKLNNNNNY